MTLRELREQLKTLHASLDMVRSDAASAYTKAAKVGIKASADLEVEIGVWKEWAKEEFSEVREILDDTRNEITNGLATLGEFRRSLKATKEHSGETRSVLAEEIDAVEDRVAELEDRVIELESAWHVEGAKVWNMATREGPMVVVGRVEEPDPNMLLKVHVPYAGEADCRTINLTLVKEWSPLRSMQTVHSLTRVRLIVRQSASPA